MADVFISFDQAGEKQALIIRNSLEAIGLTVSFSHLEDLPELDHPAAFYQVESDELSDFDGDPEHQGWRNFVASLAKTLDLPDLIERSFQNLADAAAQEYRDSGARQAPIIANDKATDFPDEQQDDAELTSIQDEIQRLKLLEADLLNREYSDANSEDDPIDRYFDDDFIGTVKTSEFPDENHSLRPVYAGLFFGLIAVAGGIGYYINQHAWTTSRLPSNDVLATQPMDYNSVRDAATVDAYERYLSDPANKNQRNIVESTVRRHRGAIADVQRALLQTGHYSSEASGKFNSELKESLNLFFAEAGINEYRSFEKINPMPIKRLAKDIETWQQRQNNSKKPELTLPPPEQPKTVNTTQISNPLLRPESPPSTTATSPEPTRLEAKRPREPFESTSDLSREILNSERDRIAYRSALENGRLNAIEEYARNSEYTRYQTQVEEAINNHRTAVKRVQSALRDDRFYSSSIDGFYDDEFRIALDQYFATSGSRSYANFFNIDIGPINQLAEEIENWQRPVVVTLSPSWAAGLTGLAEEEAKGCLENSMRLCSNLGISYRDGVDGAPRDLTKARVVFEKACSGGYQRACQHREALNTSDNLTVANNKPCPTQQFVIYFEWDKSDVTAQGAAVIDQATSNVWASGDCSLRSVTIAGHSDTYHSTAYSQLLSERRAAIVADAIISRGISSAIISKRGYGETRPAKATGDGVREPINRRVEVLIK